MKPIAVIIPTFRRPDSLERAVRSVLAQNDLDRLVGELAVVDNDPDGSAWPVVARLQQEGALVQYVHAREPGVSNARNAGLAATDSPLIAFIDDDEEAPPHWLAALHAAHEILHVDVVFGPVRGRADAAASWKRPYLERFFSREGPAATVVSEDVYGCGNTLMRRATALEGPAPFDVAANQSGGEDDRLFAELRSKGRRFGWAADAWLWEHAPASRLTAFYTLGRAFGFGQSPSQICFRARNWPGLLRWMAIGAGQALVFGGTALVLAPVFPSSALAFADRAARGLGKLFWFKTLRYYGRADASTKSTPAARSAARSGEASLNVIAAKITQ